MTEVIVEYTQLFASVPGDVIGGWTGFGLFIFLLIATLFLMGFGVVPYGASFYELVVFCLVMVVCYLLAAMEQFIYVRYEDDHVNLLMIVLNIAVWLWAVMGSARRVANRPVPLVEKYAWVFAIISQGILLISAFVWNGVVFALWALALVVMMISVGLYGATIAQGWARAQPYSKHWLIFALCYTLVYVFVAFLSHLYLGVMSLSGAVWAYLVMHASVYAWLVYSSRVTRDAMDTAGVLPTTNSGGDDVSISPLGVGLMVTEEKQAAD